MKIFIIIPYYGKYKLVNDRLLEIIQHCGNETNIVLVDDNSPAADDGASFISYWQKTTFPNLKYFKAKENKGFGSSMNTGVAIAKKNGADAVILLSDDVIVGSNILLDQQKLLEDHPDALIGGEYLCHDTGWNNLPGMGVVPYLNGWFLACSMSTWDELGGFDRQYGLFDFEDVCLSTTAHYLGIPLITTTSKLRHLGGQTVNVTHPDRVKYTKINQRLWQEKWMPKAAILRKQIYGKE